MIYVDTSALIKRYISERRSDDFDAFFLASAPLAISRLTFVEFRCALARRRRARQITAGVETDCLAELRNDVQDGALTVNPVADASVASAYHLMDRLGEVPLRSLDALHLAIAGDLGARGFATADRTQAQAAAALGFDTFRFSEND